MICEVILTIGVLWTQDDPTTRRWLQQLLHNVTGGGGMGGAPQPGLDHMMGI
jgi:CCR4-NOT transcription complex subunit 9